MINGDLSATPGLQPDLDHPLEGGGRVVFFHLKSTGRPNARKGQPWLRGWHAKWHRTRDVFTIAQGAEKACSNSD